MALFGQSNMHSTLNFWAKPVRKESNVSKLRFYCLIFYILCSEYLSSIFVDFDGRYFKSSLMKRLTYHAQCCTIWLYLLKEILTINKQCLLWIAALNIYAAAVVMIRVKPVIKVWISLDFHGPNSDLIKGDPD